MNQHIYDFKLTTIDGDEITLSKFTGKSLLIVNVASKCGFTDQYKGLESVYQEYKDKNFEILGFPCNQFGAQEPGSDQEIKEFCSLTYQVSFPMFSKTDVNGDRTAPLYQYLKKELPGLMGSQAIKWNFTKFFIDKSGAPIKRFAPKDSPEKVMNELKALL